MKCEVLPDTRLENIEKLDKYIPESKKEAFYMTMGSSVEN